MLVVKREMVLVVLGGLCEWGFVFVEGFINLNF